MEKKLKPALCIFVKTPEFSPVKTRLAKSIGESKATEFYLKCIDCIEKLATSLHSTNLVSVYWAVAETQALSSTLWGKFPKLSQGCGSLGERLSSVFDQAFIQHNEVIFIGADTPHITERDIIETIEKLKTADFVIGRAHDGGFYLFGSKTDIPAHCWNAVEYSTETTCDSLIQKLIELDPAFKIAFISPKTDVDTIANMKTLKNELTLEHTHLTELKQYLEQINSP